MKRPLNCPCGSVLVLTHHDATKYEEEYIEGNCEECWGIHVEGEYDEQVIELWNKEVKKIGA